MNSAIDLHYLEETFDGNQVIIRKILKSFMKNTPKLTAELIAKIGSSSWHETKMIAHQIKSSYYTVGAVGIGAVLEKIETASIKREKVDMETLVVQLTELSKLVFIEVSSILQKHGK